jgi:hypothetical protein
MERRNNLLRLATKTLAESAGLSYNEANEKVCKKKILSKKENVFVSHL